MKYKIFVFIFIVFFHYSNVKAQCGLDPVSGATTISTASQIINSYYPGQGNPVFGALSLTVGAIDSRGSSTPLAAGDLLLIIQMQGADINATNTDAYGDGISGGTASGYLNVNLYAGFYEYNSVASVAGSTINLSFTLANSYYTRPFASGAIRTYQVIRIPRYYDFTISGTGSVTAPSWNGSTGGMVVIDAANVCTINGSIAVNGLGFRGGGGIDLKGATAGNSNGTGTLTNTDYRWNSPITNAANLTGGAKGEGIAGTPAYVLTTGSTTITTNAVEGYTNGSMGRGAPANAGGGGTDGAPVGSNQNQYNTGGGGGGNAGTGGQGGSGWHGGAGNVNTYPTGGYGGSAFTQRSVGRFIMGGGGGAGTANNSNASNQYMSSGGAGGGIILLRAKSYAGNGSISANGANAVGVLAGGSNTDAAGGGGGGGTIVAVTRQNVTIGLNSIIANAQGGRGGNMETYFDHGPGGGGGGGMIITNGIFASTNITGGVNGLTRTGSAGGPINNSFGATVGTNGQLLTLATAPFLINANNAASPCGTLPISLTAFNATKNNSTILLNWEVANAFDFSQFEIEYSNDGISFYTLGTISYNALQQVYQFYHNQVTAVVNYYRLKLVNTNLTFRYSNILVVRSKNNYKVITIYPQPAQDYFYLNVVAEKSQISNLELYNVAGEKVRQISIQLNKGTNYVTINNIENLPGGIYLLRTRVDNNFQTEKVLITQH